MAFDRYSRVLNSTRSNGLCGFFAYSRLPEHRNKAMQDSHGNEVIKFLPVINHKLKNNIDDRKNKMR